MTSTLPSPAITALRRCDAIELVRRERLVVILRRIAPRERLLGLVEELVEAGARIFEVTLDSAEGAADLKACKRLVPGSGPLQCLVGAGTIRDPDQVAQARAAGADFGVSPVFDAAVVDAALAAGLPFIPGAYTPTEADRAWRAGATLVKLFPASSLGPGHVRELRAPLPEIEVIATGGVNASNAGAFLEAGAVAVGIGSAIAQATPAERRLLVQAIRSSP